jgi:hypothetical protein
MKAPSSFNMAEAAAAYNVGVNSDSTSIRRPGPWCDNAAHARMAGMVTTRWMMDGRPAITTVHVD